MAQSISNNIHYDRAEAELRAAERAHCVEAVRAHCALADLHLEMAYAANAETAIPARGLDVADRNSNRGGCA